MFAPMNDRQNTVLGNPMQPLLGSLLQIPLQLGKDYLYQKVGGDWLGIDKYKAREDQDMTPFQKQLLGTLGQNQNNNFNGGM